MNKVTLETIKPLLEMNDNFTLSLYLPTHRSPTSVHVQEDKIRFKNLIRAGKEALEAKGLDHDSIRKIGNRLEGEYYNNDTFWQHATEGLAIFSSQTETRYFNLPIECEEHVSAGDSYDITPLFALISYDHPYYILALALHGSELYRGDAYGVERVAIDFPESPEDALNIDEMFSNSQTVRAGGGFGPGSPSSGSHGQGDSRQAGQEERMEYFRILDDTLHSSDLVEDNLPLLIAGSEGEVADYRDVSQRKNMLKATLSGNYTSTSGVKPQQLHHLSWLLIEKELSLISRSREVEKFKELHGTGKSSTNLEEIKSALEEGRVDVLFLGLLMVTHDTVSDGNEAKTKLIFPDFYTEYGIYDCGRSAHDQGGTIIALMQDDMPDNANLAAIYRY